MTEPRHVKISMSTPCSGCGRPVPVNGPERAVRCSGCGSEIPLPDRFWSELLRKIEDDYPTLKWNYGRKEEGEIGGVRLRYLYGRKMPRCDGCDAELPAAQAEPSVAGEVACARCGLARAAYPAPGWLKSLSETVSRVFAAEDTASREPPSSERAFYLRFDGMSDRLIEMQEQAERERAEREERRRTTCPRCGNRPWSRGPGCTECGYGRALLTRRTWALLAALLAAGAVAGGAYRHLGRPPPTRTATLSWNGRVVYVENHGLPVGAPCKARFELTVRQSQIVRFALRIFCGDVVLYDVDRMPSRHRVHCSVLENDSLGSGGGIGSAHEYHVGCRSDPGGEKGGEKGFRLLFDTTQQRAIVRNADPASRVDVFLDRNDGVRSGGALFEGGPNFESIDRWEAVVTGARGAAPVRTGRRCRVLAARLREREGDCRVRVECGNRVLYGGVAQGYTDCKLEDGEPVSARERGATADDGDPMLSLDVKKMQVTVGDRDPDYQVTLALDPPGRPWSCNRNPR